MVRNVVAGSVFSVMLLGSSAFAAGQAQQNAGCELRGLLIGEGAYDSLIGQLAMTLLNGTSGNQTLGITSGTSECQAPARIVKEELKDFVTANMDSLAKDIAMGEGESLDTLAELMEISSEKKAVFFAQLQTNFSSIYTSVDVIAADVIDNIYSVTASLWRPNR